MNVSIYNCALNIKKKKRGKKNCERSPLVFVCLNSRGFAFNKKRGERKGEEKKITW